MRKLIFLLITSTFLFSSCVPKYKLSYMLDYDVNKNSFTVEKKERKILPQDQLYLRYFSIDERNRALFDVQQNLASSRDDITLVSYSVDNEGNISLPSVGKIHVAGLELAAAKAAVQERINDYISNVFIDMFFVNNRITVLGEVAQQGTHYYSKEQVNVFQALSLAGGITDYGNKKEVLLIREKEGKATILELDLTQTSITQNENYYLQQNDLLIVNAISQKHSRLRDWSVFSMALSTISMLLVTLTFFQIQPNNNR